MLDAINEMHTIQYRQIVCDAFNNKYKSDTLEK